MRIKVTEQSSLHMACQNGALETVQCLLGYSSNIEAKNKDGQTPLLLACYANSFETVKILVKKGTAQVNASDNNGYTPLLASCHSGGGPEKVEFLATNRARIDARTNNGLQPVHLACTKGHLRIVKWLIESNPGIDVLSRDFHGDTILHLACKGGHQKVVRYILKNKLVDPNELNNDHETALHYACKRGNLRAVKMLF